MSVKIFHNPRCSKSRQTLQILEEQNADPIIIEYLKTPLSEEDLGDILNKLGMEPRDILRKGEKIYKELGLADKNLSDTQIITAMVSNPILIERPIVITPKGAKIGRPPESVLEVL